MVKPPIGGGLVVTLLGSNGENIGFGKMRKQAKRKQHQRKTRSLRGEGQATRDGVATNKLRQLDEVARNILANRLGTRAILLHGKTCNRPSLANYLVYPLKLSGGFTLYKQIDGYWVIFCPYHTGEVGGFTQFGFEWIPGWGWLADESARIDEFTEFCSFFEKV